MAGSWGMLLLPAAPVRRPPPLPLLAGHTRRQAAPFQLLEVLRRKFLYVGPPSPAELDQSLALEMKQRLAHGYPADAQLPGHRRLGQKRPRLKKTVEDVGTQG